MLRDKRYKRLYADYSLQGSNMSGMKNASRTNKVVDINLPAHLIAMDSFIAFFIDNGRDPRSPVCM